MKDIQLKIEKWVSVNRDKVFHLPIVVVLLIDKYILP